MSLTSNSLRNHVNKNVTFVYVSSNFKKLLILILFDVLELIFFILTGNQYILFIKKNEVYNI